MPSTRAGSLRVPHQPPAPRGRILSQCPLRGPVLCGPSPGSVAAGSSTVSMPSTRAGSLRVHRNVGLLAQPGVHVSMPSTRAGSLRGGGLQGAPRKSPILSQCPLRGPGLCGPPGSRATCSRSSCLNALYAGRVSAGSCSQARIEGEAHAVSMPSTRAGSLRATFVFALIALIAFGSLNALYAGRVSAGLAGASYRETGWNLSQCPLRGPGLCGRTPPGRLRTPTVLSQCPLRGPGLCGIMISTYWGTNGTSSQCPLRGPGLCGPPAQARWSAACFRRLNALYAGRVSAGVMSRRTRPQPRAIVSMPSTRAGSLRAFRGERHVHGSVFPVSMPSTRAGSLRGGRRLGGQPWRQRLSQCPLRRPGLCGSSRQPPGPAASISVSMPSTRAGSLRERADGDV